VRTTPEGIAKGALVRLRNGVDGPLGIVMGTDERQPDRAVVRWADQRRSSHLPSDLTSGLKSGDEVVHLGLQEHTPSLGHGRVVTTRHVAGTTQHLVDFWHEASARWVPWQRLNRVPSVDRSLAKGYVKGPRPAESLRLRNLAYALEEWHTATGGLGHLDIDPLPHQLHVVHTILSSGTLNWMIADDVGLGKTIEVGLILAALKRRRWRRFLLVVPAGLTRQWQDEMRERFQLDDFVIYGEQILPENRAQWVPHDRVIVSIDRAKTDFHRERLALAEPWELAVFDEAHWLTRREYGWKLAKTQRYMLAEQLRSQADHVLLLSGTPHQGKDDQFRALLELLRPGPDWRRRFQRMHREPEMLGSLIVRNRKADVTDIDGNFIFRGKTSTTIEIHSQDAEIALDDGLRRYFQAGYSASAAAVGETGRAIGFTMTTYRKLAASSIAAIAGALARRLARLDGTFAPPTEPTEDAEPEAGFVEQDEATVGTASEFFHGEREVLARLAATAAKLQYTDSKVGLFFDQVLPRILSDDPKRKVLVFTEYRSTQDVLVAGLERRFGAGAVGMIRGGQPMRERREIVDRFNDDLQFMVSTEAGGEGLNMQQRCHVMVNFDLPWNPMRLVQRVGRLYRYGQKERVVVFNLKVSHTLDQAILGGMYDRLESVAKAMAGVAGENAQGLIEDILGQLIGALDIEDVLAEAATTAEARTQERVDEAIRKAQEAALRQEELLRYATGFDPDALQGLLPIGIDHLKSFVEAWLERLDTKIAERIYDGDVWVIRPSDPMRERFGYATTVRVAFDRDKARRAKAQLLDGEHPLLRHLFELSRDVTQPGATAVVDLPGGASGYSAMVRWLDDAGRALQQQYVHVWVDRNGQVSVNDPRWAEWLTRAATDVPHPGMNGHAGLPKVAAAALTSVLKERARSSARPDVPYAVSGTMAGETSTVVEGPS
jgi:superfamily II DNA or RNA helicase